MRHFLKKATKIYIIGENPKSFGNSENGGNNLDTNGNKLKDDGLKTETKSSPSGGESGSWPRQILAVAVINLVTFLQGASLPTSAISTVQLPKTSDNRTSMWLEDFPITTTEETLIDLSWLLGHLVSGIVANPVAELIGRKKSLLLDGVVMACGFVIYAVGDSALMLCLGRLLLGYPLVSTVFICELVHPNLRGLSAAIYAVTHALGYSFILLMGYLMPHWRLAMAVVAAIALVSLPLILLAVPESPEWLVRRGKFPEAEKSLRRVRGRRYDVKGELDELCESSVKNQNGFTDLKDLCQSLSAQSFRLPFSLLFVLFLAMGWSGFTYIALNAVEIFHSTALDIDSFLLSFLVSLMKIPGGLFAALFLAKFPRRPVFFASAFLVALGHVLMGLTQMSHLPAWVALLSMTFVFFGYSAGYSSVASLLLGEILPANLRSIGVGLIATTEVVSSLIQTATTSPLEALIGKSGLFFIFAGVVFSALLFAVGYMPETAGLTLEQIESVWRCQKRHPGCTIRRDPKEEYRRLSTLMVSTSNSSTRNNRRGKEKRSQSSGNVLQGQKRFFSFCEKLRRTKSAATSSS